MTQYNAISEILEAVEEQNINIVKFHFSDISGTFQEIDVPAALLETAFTKGLPFDNSDGGTFTPTGSDLMLKPDPRTFSVLEFGSSGLKIGHIICELIFLDGQAFDGCVRSALKLYVRKIFQSGYIFSISASLSFYLFDSDFLTNGTRSPLDLETLNKAEKTKRDILAVFNSADLEVVSLRQTNSGGPITIVFKEGSVLRIADNIMTAKYIVSAVSYANGLHASFMPKPLTDAEGLSTIFGFTLMKDEFNEFYHPNQEMMISDQACGFIGGIFKHICAICAVTNPTVNSYKRIVQKGMAPYYISWSVVDRHSLVRLPSSRGRATRIEVQNADSSCNPYLSLLAFLAAGVSGIAESPALIAPVNFETHDYSESEKLSLSAGSLPHTLREALDAFEADTFIQETLGDSLSSTLSQTSSIEWNDYIGRVHLWELKKYL